MAEPRDPRSPEVFRRYVALLQDINVMGVMGFAVMLDNVEAEEMTNLLNIVMHLQSLIDSKKGK
jgi:hypothetical protein